MAEIKKTPPSGASNKKIIDKKPVKKPAQNASHNEAGKETGNFAVIETGGKQYLVKSGDKIKVEKLAKPAKGNTINFDKVLLTVKGDDVKIGKPYLAGAKIKAEWVAEKRAKKITNIKYKSKTRQSTKKGHRQTYTEVLIADF